MNAKLRALGSDIHSLIRRCLKNDRHAQLMLYDRFAKSMYNSSLRIIKDTMEAEDIVQESFISAFKSLATFSNEVPFDAWLRRIVINKSLDHLRKRKVNFIEISEETEKLAEEMTMDNNNSSEAERKHKLEKIHKAVLQLPDGFRAIFSLFYYEGYDHEEISSILGITPSTSRSQLARAKQKVIQSLH